MRVESDVSGDRGVLKEMIREAKTDAICPGKDMPLVDVHFFGYIAQTGKVLCDTREGYNEFYSFEIGRGDIFEGLEMAIQTMKVGEIAKVTLMPEYAYGCRAIPPEIPENAIVIFEVELVGCQARRYALPCSPSNCITGTQESEIFESVDEDAIMEAERREREAEVVGGVYDLTGDGGVLKKVIRKAEDNAIGTSSLSIVTVWHSGYTIEVESGEIDDSTSEDDTDMEDDTDLTCAGIMTFTHGSGIVMEGWDIALSNMKVGDIAKITCKPTYAYGKEGWPPEIPPNATVTSTLRFVKCRDFECPADVAKPLTAEEYKELRIQVSLAEGYDVVAAPPWQAKEAAAAAAAAWQAKQEAVASAAAAISACKDPKKAAAAAAAAISVCEEAAAAAAISACKDPKKAAAAAAAAAISVCEEAAARVQAKLDAKNNQPKGKKRKLVSR